MSGVAEMYDATRRALDAAILTGSPLDGAVREWLTDHPLPPSVIVPVAAAGRLSAASTALSASLALLLLAMRWLDDLVDQDREGQLWEVRGPGLAGVLASSALTHAWACLARESALPRDILVAFGDMTAILALGEHEDASNPPTTIAEWQRIAWRKTGVAYRFAVWAGARITGDAAWEQNAPIYGENLGLYLQAADDIAGVFEDGGPDLVVGATITLPMVELLGEAPDALETFQRREGAILTEMLDDQGVRARCEARAAAYAAEARTALARSPGPWTTACSGLLGALCGLHPHNNLDTQTHGR